MTVGCMVGCSIIWVHKRKTICRHKFCSWRQEQAKVHLRQNEESEKICDDVTGYTST